MKNQHPWTRSVESCLEGQMATLLRKQLPFGLFVGYQVQQGGPFKDETQGDLSYAIPDPFHEVVGALGEHILKLLKPYRLQTG